MMCGMSEVVDVWGRICEYVCGGYSSSDDGDAV